MQQSMPAGLCTWVEGPPLVAMPVLSARVTWRLFMECALVGVRHEQAGSEMRNLSRCTSLIKIRSVWLSARVLGLAVRAVGLGGGEQSTRIVLFSPLSTKVYRSN
jgi:hypothetical protein